MRTKKMRHLQQGRNSEWSSLGERLSLLNRDKFDTLLGALRQVVEAEENGRREMPKRSRRRYLV